MYCQNCRTPLKADRSLSNLNPAAFDLLVGPVNKAQRPTTGASSNVYPQERRQLYDRTIQQSSSPLYKRNIPGPKPEEKNKQLDRSQLNQGMSFIEITDSQIVSQDTTQSTLGPIQAKNRDAIKEEHTLSWDLYKHEQMYSILSSRSDIDHPICSECSSALITQMNSRLTTATRERDGYSSFLKSLHQSSAHHESDKVRSELNSLKKEEEEVFQELLELEGVKQKLEEELADLEEEDRQLDLQEEQFWVSRNAFDEKMYNLQSELVSLQERYAHDQKQLERLHRTNVYNDTFCIGHDGLFGTINGLRLGRLAGQNVEWTEINAAWGQTLLLLATVAERLGYTFRGYRLRPLGSTSRIEKLEWPQQPPEPSQRSTTNPMPKVTPLDLFSSGEMPLGRMFNHRKFDAGMIAFLDCLSQLGKFVEQSARASGQMSRDSKAKTFALPFDIQNDRIGDVSIKLGAGFSQDENFTKACKFTLTCCKFLLAHVSNLENTKT